MRSGPWTKFLAILIPPHTKTLLLNMYVAVMVFDQPPSPAQHLYMWWFENGCSAKAKSIVPAYFCLLCEFTNYAPPL